VTGQHFSKISNHLQRFAPNDLDSAISVDVELAPKEDRVIRFVLTWYSPLWRGEKNNVFSRMYTMDWSGSLAAAKSLAENHASLLKRVIAWQEVLYGEQSLPDYLRDSLINIFHLITKTGFWAVAKPPLPSWVREDDGLFGMNESPRECPQIECIPCSFYATSRWFISFRNWHAPLCVPIRAISIPMAVRRGFSAASPPVRSMARCPPMALTWPRPRPDIRAR